MPYELIARLRKPDEWTNTRPYFHAHPKCLEAARRLETLTAENERLREALKQLIDHCREQERIITEEMHHRDYWGESIVLCEARAALEQGEQ